MIWLINAGGVHDLLVLLDVGTIPVFTKLTSKLARC
jgi:hypothetical protein